MVDYNEFNNNNFMYHNGVIIIISSTRGKRSPNHHPFNKSLTQVVKNQK